MKRDEMRKILRQHKTVGVSYMTMDELRAECEKLGYDVGVKPEVKPAESDESGFDAMNDSFNDMPTPVGGNPFASLVEQVTREVLPEEAVGKGVEYKPKRTLCEYRNGVVAPLRGVCRDVWDYCNELLEDEDDHSYLTKEFFQKVTAHGKEVGWNANNVSQEVCRWRKFCGYKRVQNGDWQLGGEAE